MFLETESRETLRFDGKQNYLTKLFTHSLSKGRKKSYLYNMYTVKYSLLLHTCILLAVLYGQIFHCFYALLRNI